ncbi:acyltransferase family protein [Paenarthrobacter nicotinovorans]|uniref:acyltransferase family protein n=1 Tax=Paenarthrobacter nicotinovorans TaxID=29320 RepID=UPI0027D80300|nr:acyltransferase family protein [Paenarthrobacter nicotinovorans]
MATSMLRSDRARSASPTKPAFRTDIQGLRAVAVLLVVLFHAKVPWLPGGFVGVDVFFVISGFLITAGIVKELRRDGKLSITGFYARRIARILPASTVAILVTLGATWILLPQTRWEQIGGDSLASALYYVNWLFAGNAVNYMAQDAAESPLQHFWSLAVEEQFYVVWPVLLMLVTFLSLKLGFKLQRGLITVLGLVVVSSLAWSIYYTSANPGGAYFVTTTRAWELAIGAGLAILAGKARPLNRAASAILGWTGLAAIAYAGVTFTGAMPFPSYTALLPVLGTAAVIWAGFEAGKAGPVAVIGIRPMVFVGNLSYSLYLWHWPALVITAGVVGELSQGPALAIVGLSVVVAWLSLKYIEKPSQRWLSQGHAGPNPLALGFIMTASTTVAAIFLMLLVPPVPPSSSVAFTPTTVSGKAKLIGAETLFGVAAPAAAADIADGLQPAPVAAVKDLHRVNLDGCMQDVESVEPRACVFGNADGVTTIAVVGDSHAAMLMPGFEKVAVDNKWKIVSYTKGACPWIDVNVNYANKPFEQCRKWVGGVTEALMKDQPDIIVSAMSRYRTNDGVMDQGTVSDDKLIEGMRATWAPFIAKGTKIVSVRDTPRPGSIVPDCVAKNLESKTLSSCALSKSASLIEDPPEAVAVQGVTGASLLDMTDSFCFGETCPAVIGDVLVYRDDNHLTATYARTLHNQISAVLKPLIQ